VKWNRPTGSVQQTADDRFCIVQATEHNWVAYELGPTTGVELGVKPTDEQARQVCEDHERQAMRRRA